MIKFYLFDQLVMSIDEKLIKSLAEREAISLLVVSLGSAMRQKLWKVTKTI